MLANSARSGRWEDFLSHGKSPLPTAARPSGDAAFRHTLHQ
ncbi:hypothetical protein HMPREF0972_01025 [Actinomyces sp. oral taxon 848 str. F0332]|nr:hypothetical protein HMPREF0972_01025 [Actinomyces sp. oral taxon 848 str. F0332]